MGEAKRRGPREQRVAEGIEKRRLAEAERKARWDARWKRMTPDERMALVQTLALAATFGVSPP